MESILTIPTHGKTVSDKAGVHRLLRASVVIKVVLGDGSINSLTTGTYGDKKILMG